MWNFRDFGGYAAADGAVVRTGRLFRSANFAEASESDIARLDHLDVRAVVDLRHPAEREAAPSRWPAGGAPLELHRMPEPRPATAAPVASPDEPQPFSAAIARANMLGAYRRIPSDPAFVALLNRLLQGLAEHGGPVVIHCTSGKDRTGIACLLVLAALGVDYPAIEADYLTTNASFDLAERRRVVRANLESEIGRSPTDDEIEPLLGVEPGYLAAALQTIDDAGGVDVYLDRTLGVSRQTRARLRDRLCV